jgi:hypothetical protein
MRTRNDAVLVTQNFMLPSDVIAMLQPRGKSDADLRCGSSLVCMAVKDPR